MSENKTLILKFTEEIDELKMSKEILTSHLLDTSKQLKKIKKENMLLRNNPNLENKDTDVNISDIQGNLNKEITAVKKEDETLLDSKGKIDNDFCKNENEESNDLSYFARMFVHTPKVKFNYLILN